MCCIQIAYKHSTLRCVVLKVAHRNMLKIAHHFSLLRECLKNSRSSLNNNTAIIQAVIVVNPQNNLINLLLY